MSIPPDNILDMYLNFAECQADVAGHIISAMPHQKIQPQQKPDSSLLTELDSSIETTIRNNIKSQFPQHGIVGEEVAEHQPYAEYQWIIDPIDGTQEFVNGSPLFGFIISLQHLGMPILGIIDHPLLELRCKAMVSQGAFANDVALQMRHTPKSQQGIVMPARADFTKYDNEEHLFNKISSEFPNYRVFRSCYGHSSTLLGHTCMTIEHDVHIWDVVATRVLIEEAGGLFHVLRKKKRNRKIDDALSV
jgi:fructose-1,6-bisphosphatase/inositol monophosphatase family enzyme